mmetsp:Transcript_32559/g.107668  ORF Transcript_32559/g.107668 Transcript_32559/m.107668 type:complete len:204 (+) Transcript_32559:656-1267(+)
MRARVRISQLVVVERVAEALKAEERKGTAVDEIDVLQVAERLPHRLVALARAVLGDGAAKKRRLIVDESDALPKLHVVVEHQAEGELRRADELGEPLEAKARRPHPELVGPLGQDEEVVAGPALEILLRLLRLDSHDLHVLLALASEVDHRLRQVQQSAIGAPARRRQDREAEARRPDAIVRRIEELEPVRQAVTGCRHPAFL